MQCRGQPASGGGLFLREFRRVCTILYGAPKRGANHGRNVSKWIGCADLDDDQPSESPPNGRPMPPQMTAWRREFPILASTTYLISNSLGAMPRGAASRL